MREEWRDVVGFEGQYKVSSWARILNVRSGRVLKGAPNAKGYITVRLTKERYRSQTYYLHRLVCMAFHGPPPSPAHVVNHLSGQKLVCEPGNLAWVTRTENAAHASKLGLLTGARGTKNASARLTDEAVVEMRRRSHEGASYTQLAHEFGVSVSAAYRAVVGLSWKHVA